MDVHEFTAVRVARAAAPQRRLRASRLSPRQQDILIARMVPFVIRNYNAVELGPRGTGKSHLFQQVSPYAHLVSGGKATIANMFVNMNTGRRGLVAQYDVICFDEVSGVSFDQKEGVNILKGYMESGEFSRGRESIRAEGGIVMVGNFDVDVETQLRVGHLLEPLPKEMRNDTAFMDRIHAYLPGWDVPKLDPSYFTEHFGFVSDYLAEVWSQLRDCSRLEVLQGRLEWGSTTQRTRPQGREQHRGRAAPTALSEPEMEVPDEFLAWAASLALEMRRRVKEAQAFIGAAEFGKVDLSYRLGDGPETVVYCEESVRHRMRIAGERPPTVTRRQLTARCSRCRTRKECHHPRLKPATTRVGDTIGGRFEVKEVLGERRVLEGVPRARRRRRRGASAQAVRQRSRLRGRPPGDRGTAEGRSPQRRRR